MNFCHHMSVPATPPATASERTARDQIVVREPDELVDRLEDAVVDGFRVGPPVVPEEDAFGRQQLVRRMKLRQSQIYRRIKVRPCRPGRSNRQNPNGGTFFVGQAF